MSLWTPLPSNSSRSSGRAILLTTAPRAQQVSSPAPFLCHQLPVGYTCVNRELEQILEARSQHSCPGLQLGCIMGPALARKPGRGTASWRPLKTGTAGVNSEQSLHREEMTGSMAQYTVRHPKSFGGSRACHNIRGLPFRNSVS